MWGPFNEIFGLFGATLGTVAGFAVYVSVPLSCKPGLFFPPNLLPNLLWDPMGAPSDAPFICLGFGPYSRMEWALGFGGLGFIGAFLYRVWESNRE